MRKLAKSCSFSALDMRHILQDQKTFKFFILNNRFRLQYQIHNILKQDLFLFSSTAK